MNESEKQRLTERAMDVLEKNFAKLVDGDGVSGSGVGFRMKNGEFTDEICIVIEVKRKLPLDALEKVVPTRVEDIAVDVVEAPEYREEVLLIPASQVDDNQKLYRPLAGGSQITNGKPDPQGLIAVGTLGCVVHLPGKKGGTNVLLSNHHVMYANGGKNEDTMGQPDVGHAIGKISGGKKVGAELDVAVATVNEGIASSNDVIDIGVLTGFGNAYVGQFVKKYGRTTGYTAGQVARVGFRMNGNDRVYTGLTIYAGYPKIDPALKFSKGGDSGAVIVNNLNQVVGLHWGGDEPRVPKPSFANDQRRLKEFHGDFQIPIPHALQMQQLFSDTKRLDYYQKLLSESSHAKAVLSAFLSNVDEGIRLVNEHRECMVAWQRLKGPAFISLAKNLNVDEPYRLEKLIDGVSRETFARKMMMVFREHGSESMVEALDNYGDEMITFIRNAETVEDVIDQLIKV